MDTPQAAQLTRILNYAPGSIGSLVQIPALTALGDWSVKHAQREVKKIRNRSLFDFPIVDDDHHFLGLVTVHSLLIAKEHVRLEELCTGKNLALPAYTTIASVINHPLWTNHLSLPVIDRGGIFMGLLFNAAIKDQTSGSFGTHSQDVLAPVMAIAELYWAATSSVIETFGKKMASQHKSN